MPAIQEQQWQEVGALTWGDVDTHKWEDFRTALVVQETEMEAHNVLVVGSKATSDTITETDAQGVLMLHSPVVMRTMTEMIPNIIVSERDYRSEMLKMLPTYERKSGVFKQILTAYDREFRNNEQNLEIIERNMFLRSAIETLGLYEKELGIELNPSLTHNQRREQIAARSRAVFDQTTTDTIEQVAAAYGNGEIEIASTTTPGVYEIRFIGIGVPDNFSGFKEAMDVIVPAHLEIKYVFTYNPWSSVSKTTWSEAATMTWDALRTWNEVS